MSARTMKYHIVEKDTGNPLTWDDKAIEFDTESEAYHFAVTADIRLGLDADIKHQILYYDGGYITGREALTAFLEERI